MGTDLHHVKELVNGGFHSFGVPSEWGHVPILSAVHGISRFHSFGVPSEWGPLTVRVMVNRKMSVSILLESPASGDYPKPRSGGVAGRLRVFPFFWSPQRVGTYKLVRIERGRDSGFHSFGVPSEWGLGKAKHQGRNPRFSFHSFGVPSEWGLSRVRPHQS